MSGTKKYLVLFFVIIAIVFFLTFFFSPRKQQRFVIFFSGAGMKIPVSEIVKNFTDLTGIKVDVHFEGSAILVQHIKTYGDADLFMSGDKKNMDILIEDGFVKESIFIAWHIPSILLPIDNKKNIRGLSDLSRKDVRFVMSNPAQASLGKVVIDMFRRHPKGKDILNNVAVYGSDSQDDLMLFRDFYKKGKADAVIEWDIMTRVPEGKGLMVIPFEKKYEIKDSLSLAFLKTSKNPAIAKRFYDYFRTEGVKIFKKHGYNTGVGK